MDPFTRPVSAIKLAKPARESWQYLTKESSRNNVFRLIAHQATQQLTPLIENHR